MQSPAAAAPLFATLAILLLVASHMLVASVGLVAFAGLALILALAFVLLPALVFATLLFVVLFQNALLALLIAQIDGHADFQNIQASSFIISLAVGGLAAVMLLRHPASRVQQPVLVAMAVFILITAAYAVLGVSQVSVASALSYVRLYLGGPLMLLTGLWLAQMLSPALVRGLLLFAAALLVAWGVAEFVIPHALYAFFNVDDFLRTKFALHDGRGEYDSIKETIERNTRSYLNLSGVFGLSFETLRLKGALLHEVSYGYALAFMGLALLMLRATALAIGCILVALVVGAKGPLLLLFIPLVVYGIYKVSGRPRFALAVLLVLLGAYLAAGIAYGLYTRDYHVVGFIGGLNGVLGSPLGHGIGVGGNLSDTAMAGKDFARFQQEGADYALESAWGVLLYQMGFVGFAAFAWFYARLWRASWVQAVAGQVAAPRMLLLPLALAVLPVNMVFQEEALSPAGWGLWLLFAGAAFVWQRQAASNSFK